jgi:hypothetical protein
MAIVGRSASLLADRLADRLARLPAYRHTIAAILR